MNSQSIYAIQSTAGAIPVRNEKGEISMQKVKVHRYVSGKRPDYAQDVQSDSESDIDDFMDRRSQSLLAANQTRGEALLLGVGGDRSGEVDGGEVGADGVMDPRLRRLRIANEADTEVRPERRRHVHEPEVLESSESEDEEEEEGEQINLPEFKHTLEAGPSDDESSCSLSDTEIERKRSLLKLRILHSTTSPPTSPLPTTPTKSKTKTKKSKKNSSSSSSSSSNEEEEEYTTESDEEEEEEENGPRLKPIFVRKRDRITIIEKDKEALKQAKLEQDRVRAAAERKRQTLQLVEDHIRRENALKLKKTDTNEPSLADVCTEDENDEVEYEAWKLRELKRIKRDREERENAEREKVEVDRLRGMTEEERRAQLRLCPKNVTNKAAKGKYKFLQKYYHRGAFYLDKEDEVYKRDFAQATLEDHFDKTILPKVMQVKNFGRSGRTKYTHLVDQDTTQFDCAWSTETPQNLKFSNSQAGGVKQVFEKPSLKKRKI